MKKLRSRYLPAPQFFHVTHLLLIALLAGSLLLSLADLIFHTQQLNFLIIIIIVCLSIGALWASFKLLSKVILFPIVKLIEWMEIEVINPA